MTEMNFHGSDLIVEANDNFEHTVDRFPELTWTLIVS